MSLVEKSGADSTPSFEEQMRKAEAEAGITDEEYYAGFGVEHPEPDESGRIPASREPEAEVEAEAEPEAAPDTQDGEPELESEPEVDELAEIKKKLGQLVNENAEMRRALSEQPDSTQQLQEWLAQAAEAERGAYTPDQFEELLGANPAQATIAAWQRGDQYGYARAWQAWDDVAPGAPQIWADNQNLKAQLAEYQKNIADQIAPARAAAGRQELNDAMSAVAARHDDYAEVMGSATEDDLKALVTERPLLAKILEEGLLGDRAAKEQVYEVLYDWRKSKVGDQLVQAARETPKRQSEEARKAKREAFVGSASTTTPDEVPETEEQRLTRVWSESRPRLRDAWENRAPSRIGR